MRSIIGSFKKKFSRGHGAGVSGHTLMNPTREWVAGLAVTGVLFIALSGYATYNFYSQSKAINIVPKSDEQIIVYRQQLVIQALEYYRERERVFMELRNEHTVPEVTEPKPPQVVDTRNSAGQESLATPVVSE